MRDSPFNELRLNNVELLTLWPCDIDRNGPFLIVFPYDLQGRQLSHCEYRMLRRVNHLTIHA